MPATVASAIDLDIDDGVYYPSSDGKPMAETPDHARCMVLLFQALEDYFRDQPAMYVAMNMNWYWEKGNRKACRGPDVMLIPGVEQKKTRNSFRSWNESGLVPAVCFEMASKKTWKKNLGEVKDDYESHGVKEYFLFDPQFQFLDTPLIGFRLHRGRYVAIPYEGDGSLISRQLGLRALPAGLLLRLYDLKTGELILIKDERIEQERQRAEQERQRAEQERQRAERAESRADQLAVEVDRLRRMLAESGTAPNGAH